MLRNLLIAFALVSMLGLFAGCDGSGSESVFSAPAGDAVEEQMADVALESDLMTAELVSGELEAMAVLVPGAGTGEGPGVITDERTFSRTRSCPAGGQLAVEGTILRTFDPQTGVMEADSSGTRARTDCAFVRNDLTITVNGSAGWEKFRRRVDGTPDGPQTSHYYGSWVAVRSDGEERSCEFDYTIVRDPDTRTRTLEGTLCGFRVRRGVAWNLFD